MILTFPLDYALESVCHMELHGYSKLIIPLNPDSNHWVLLVADLLKKQLSFYDPVSESVKPVYEKSICNWRQMLVKILGGTLEGLASELS